MRKIDVVGVLGEILDLVEGYELDESIQDCKERFDLVKEYIDKKLEYLDEF